MATKPITVRQMLVDPMIERAVNTTAQMFGLSQAAVAMIAQVALPMMARLAESSPELFERMYVAAHAALPEPIREYYVRMALNPSLRQAAVDDYKATYGTMFDAVHREAARQAGITDGQARDVMATILPALNQALVDARTVDDPQSFARQLEILRGLCTAAP